MNIDSILSHYPIWRGNHYICMLCNKIFLIGCQTNLLSETKNSTLKDDSNKSIKDKLKQ